MMRKLTSEEIEEFANRPNVKKVAVENFLMNMGTDITLITAMGNLGFDTKSFEWNQETIYAIADGILLAAGLEEGDMADTKMI